MALKRGICLFLACMGLLLSACAVAQEVECHFDSSREVAAYLQEADMEFSFQSNETIDAFVVNYKLSNATALKEVPVRAYVYEDSAAVMVSGIVTPDNSDMLKLYENLEALNDSVSFIRFIYDAENNKVFCQADVPYVADADFGAMVERYMYITALTVDDHYEELAALRN